MANSSSPDDYVLGRSSSAATRLNLQHYMFKDEDGFLVHPDIKDLSENTVLADIGCGTGLWLMDLSSQVPASWELHGFDIDISQAPPVEWLSKNISIGTLDIFAEIPENLVGRFDVINIRLFVLVVPNNNPHPLIQNLKKMLKPGGWLQWSEVNKESIRIITAREGVQTKWLQEAADFPFYKGSMDHPSIDPHWVPSLGELLKANGMDLLSQKTQPISPRNLRMFNDMMFLLWEEMRSHMEPEQAQKYRTILNNAETERMQYNAMGAYVYDKWFFVARKPIVQEM